MESYVDGGLVYCYLGMVQIRKIVKETFIRFIYLDNFFFHKPNMH